MGKVCVSLVAETTEEALQQAHRAKELGADMVEFRLDYMKSPDPAGLFGHAPLPSVATCRRKSEGGKNELPENERLELLRSSARSGAAYVDIEFGREKELGDVSPAKVIVSHHDFERTPDDIPSLAARMARTGADVCKLVTTAHDPMDCLPLYDVIAASPDRWVCFAMGEGGEASRVLSLRFGAAWSYAYLDDCPAAAPGQIALSEMVTLYRCGSLSPKTKLYGVMGDPIAHSMSPAIHNAAFVALGMDAVYVKFRVTGNPGEFIKAYSRLGFSGFSVTIPHKETVRRALDEEDEAVSTMGAANTVDVREGKLFGTNTDRDAAVGPILRALEAQNASGGLKGKSVLVLGAGGAARAIVSGLCAAGAEVTIANRTESRGQALAAEFNCRAVPRSEMAKVDFDVLVNATSVGMSPEVDTSPVPKGFLDSLRATEPAGHRRIVFDSVYNPPLTKLLRDAERAGATTVSGIEMFVAQAATQFEIWTGRTAPVDVMRKTVERKLDSTFTPSSACSHWDRGRHRKSSD